MPRNGTSMREEPRIKQRNRLLTILWAHASFVPPASGREHFRGACCSQGRLLRFASAISRIPGCSLPRGACFTVRRWFAAVFLAPGPWLLATARDIFYNSPAIRSVFFAPLTARCRQGHVLRFPGGLRRFFGSLAAGGCSQGHILQFAGGLRRFLASLAARCSRAMEHGQTVVLHWGIQAAFLAIGGLTTVHYFLHFCRGSLHYLSSSYWGSHYTTSRYPPYKSAPVCLS